MPITGLVTRGVGRGSRWIQHGARASLLTACLITTAAIPAAAQDKVHPVPVKTKQVTYYCGDVDMLKYRERLVRERRTEESQRLDMLMGPFSGKCGRIDAGKWMFYTGWSKDGDYVSLRFKFGGERAWVARTSLEDLPTVLPGRTLKQGNGGSTCVHWEPIAAQSRARSTKMAADLQARSRSTSFLQMTVQTAAGVKDADGACENFTQRLVDLNRERIAVHWCPKLGANGRSAEIEKLLDTAEYYVENFCLPKN